MLRKRLSVVAAFMALAVGACGFGPTSPMPPEDDMLVVQNLRVMCALVDSVGR